MAQRLNHTEPMSWSAYRAWNRACTRHAWRATRAHFGHGWRSVAEVVIPACAVMLLALRWSGTEEVRDIARSIGAGVTVSMLWALLVFCWYSAIAPYRLWRAAEARIGQLTSSRRADPQAITRDLELCIREGQALMNTAKPSKRELSKWYDRVLRVVSRASAGDRWLLETLGPAPGTRGGALEMLILGNRIEKLRMILRRQHSRRARHRPAA